MLDPIHKLAQGSFREKFGYPAWFVPCVGLYELSIAYLNFYGGANQWIAQKLLATLMGGAIYTHVKIDRSLPGTIFAFSFFYSSCAVPPQLAPEPLLLALERSPYPNLHI